ncbi:MAG: hypothetical protein PWR03_63 [Tenuifilum sp.]|jgi:predicted Fe-Mo cluster-binding NifX family protein|uniref:NifB/NifX family molybdenum-iron cluster-binding protein n=1 Tax=Tenuifilum sp. TaxID=2760880 RepID=UPI0024AA363A|nr:NifB/NifX family molybdenum-iron cluster-binding protein [Tenuifilum sp.]MDI3525880.1 hypothetical protein [Tenuifilum sp.]
MKIAVPTRENLVDEHFGHCEFYTIYTVENGSIVKKETLGSPQGCGCKSNIASDFQNMGVSLMLAGGIGAGAINVLAAHGVEVVRGCSGNVDKVVNDYLSGNLTDSGETCNHHGHHHEGHQHGHSCNH